MDESTPPPGLRPGIPVYSFDWLHVGDVIRGDDHYIEVGNSDGRRLLRTDSLLAVTEEYALLICNASGVRAYEMRRP